MNTPSLRQARAQTLGSHSENFLIEQARERDLGCLTSAQWETDSCLDDIAGDVLCRVEFQLTGRTELVIEVQDGIAYLRLHDHTLIAVLATATRERSQAGLDAIRTALPPLEPAERTVPGHFWWQEGSAARQSVRKIPTLDWDEIHANYVAATHSDLADMSAWAAPPSGGRLIVWHGDSGTGKTSAIRFLAGTWRDWSQFHFVTDPEHFLRSSSYLLEVVASGQDATLRGGNATSPGYEPWRIIVLEDSGEFLTPDAKHEQGQAVSRLLNVCDGILGEAMKVIVFLTTNEPIRRLDPALTRPGRLLRSTEFERFDATAAAQWLTAAGQDPTVAGDSASHTLAELYAVAEDPLRVLKKEDRAIGFAA